MITSKNTFSLTFHWSECKNKIFTLRSNGCHRLLFTAESAVYIPVKVIVSLIFTPMTQSCAKVKDAGELQNMSPCTRTQCPCQFRWTWQWVLRESEVWGERRWRPTFANVHRSLLFVNTQKICMFTRHGKILFVLLWGWLPKELNSSNVAETSTSEKPRTTLRELRTQVYYASRLKSINTPSSGVRTKG